MENIEQKFYDLYCFKNKYNKKPKRKKEHCEERSLAIVISYIMQPKCNQMQMNEN